MRHVAAGIPTQKRRDVGQYGQFGSRGKRFGASRARPGQVGSATQTRQADACWAGAHAAPGGGGLLCRLLQYARVLASAHAQLDDALAQRRTALPKITPRGVGARRDRRALCLGMGECSAVQSRARTGRSRGVRQRNRAGWWSGLDRDAALRDGMRFCVWAGGATRK